MGTAHTDFEAFIRARGPHYLRLAMGLASSRPSAEDLFQTAAERLLRRWSSFHGLDNPDAYFRQVLVNAAIDAGRRRGRRPEHLVAAVPERPVTEGNADPGTDVVIELLAVLPPRQRAVVILRVLEDLDVRATGQLLGISDGTVKSALSRGLVTLRVALDTTKGPS